jgi:hypothetical protein
MNGPQRIVCRTEETTETLYLLGEDERIVGISGFTCRPKEARQQKPKVSAFTSAKIEKILELRPDLFRRVVYVSCIAPLPGQGRLTWNPPIHTIAVTTIASASSFQRPTKGGA